MDQREILQRLLNEAQKKKNNSEEFANEFLVSSVMFFFFFENELDTLFNGLLCLTCRS